MLTIIALIAAQAAPAPAAALPTQPFEAATMCARAVTLAGMGTKSPLDLASGYTYYVMHATLAKPMGKPFLDRLGTLSGEASSGEPTEAAAAAALVPQCKKRFPIAPAPSAPAMPTGFDRDVMCFGTLSLLQGAAEEFASNGGAKEPLEHIQETLAPLLARMTDDTLKANGVNGEADFLKRMGDQLIASMKIGEPLAVARKCGLSGV
ncbi:hypothetical protein ACG3SL_07910 [Sphingomonas sp. CJ20]